MNRFKYSILAAAGIFALASVLSLIGPRKVMAALGYTPIRDVDNPAGNPRAELTAYTAASSITTDVFLAQVPAGKRQVIEHFSVTASVPNGQTGFFFIRSRAGGTNCIYTLPVTQQFADPQFPGSDILVSAHPVRIYADPGTVPSISFRRTSSSGSASFQASVSGYCVNL